MHPGTAILRVGALLALAAVVVVAPAPAAAGKCTAKHRAACAKPKPKPIAVVSARVSLGGPVFSIVDGFGSLWIRTGGSSTTGGDTIDRIDPATNAVTARIPVGAGFGLAAGDGAVWAPNTAAETLTRVDPATNAVAPVIALPDVGADAVATTSGAVWVGTAGTDNAPGVLVRVDPSTNAVVSTTPLADGADYGAANSAAAWFVVGQKIDRVDAASGAVTELPGEVAHQTPCGNIAASDAGVWLAGGTCGVADFGVEKLHPVNGTVIWGLLTQPQPVDISIGSGVIWATTTTGTLIRVSETVAKETGSMKLDLGTAPVVGAAFGAVWVADSTTGALERLTPQS